jgi:hypothetical protein
VGKRRRTKEQGRKSGGVEELAVARYETRDTDREDPRQRVSQVRDTLCVSVRKRQTDRQTDRDRDRVRVFFCLSVSMWQAREIRTYRQR